jgi:hypothetical protein
MTFPDMTVAPSLSANAALRPLAPGASLAPRKLAAAQPDSGAARSFAGLPSREHGLADDVRRAEDIRRAEAWLAERQIGLIV